MPNGAAAACRNFIRVSNRRPAAYGLHLPLTSPPPRPLGQLQTHCNCFYQVAGLALGEAMAATDAQTLKSLFHSLGLRSTGARIAVYRALAEAERPLTHAEVSGELEDAGFDHATIFRNLTDLTQVGLVVRTDLGDHVWRFELRGDGKQSHREQHPHFLCTDCGGVSCLPEGAISLKRTKGAPKGLFATAVVVQVQGVCDDCQPEARSR